MKRVTGPDEAAQGLGKEEAAAGFAETVIAWQKRHGRHALPWQNTRDPYRVWLSEIMLQQTQVAAVIPYYQRFLQRFPDVQTLAAAASEEVMAHWSGLGYYSRARNLHRCAQRVCAEYAGSFPSDPALLQDLPGIGRSTAAAIAAFAYGARAAILDGNVKRVFCRVFGIDGYPGEKKIESALWRRAETLLPQRDMEAYTQGLMDLGATVCTRSKPSCASCPLARRCVAHAAGRVNELPRRKPKKTIPEKHAAMLAIIDGGEVLLERRPDSGIWGGLLSLPEFPCDEESSALALLPALESLAARFGAVSSCERLHSFTHVFTHYKLHVTPFAARLAQRAGLAGEERYVWYRADRLAQAPLPAPVKKLLLSLLPGEDLFSPRV